MKIEYKTIPCTEEDEEFIREKLEAISDTIVSTQEGAKDEILVFKITDAATLGWKSPSHSAPLAQDACMSVLTGWSCLRGS